MDEQRLRSYHEQDALSDTTLNPPNVDKLFDLANPQATIAKDLVCGTVKELCSVIRPYISRHNISSAVEYWPLVEKVEIFVKADLLRGGVVLVDLPTEGSDLDSLTQAVRNTYHKLDRVIMVAEAYNAVVDVRRLLSSGLAPELGVAIGKVDSIN